MARSRDLFDDTTMSFGEHLEVLRVHLMRAIVGLVICVGLCLFFGDRIFAILRTPIESVLQARGIEGYEIDAPKEPFYTYILRYFRDEEPPEEDKEPDPSVSAALPPGRIRVTIPLKDLMRQGLVPADHKSVRPVPAKSDSSPTSPLAESAGTAANVPPGSGPEESISLVLAAPEFAQLQQLIRDMSQVTTLKAEEGFMTYIKVCGIAGFFLASPWIFYQLWLFVAAGLHPHERKYMYIYLPMSIVLFVAGGLAGFYYAFPLMLQFFVTFNEWLNITLQPRLSEYITLALIMPLMFGVSFQLPLVMLFLERIGIFTMDQYRQNRRMAILVISILSMILTTSPDPYSMLLMMLPLIALYEVGIQLCKLRLTGPASPIR